MLNRPSPAARIALLSLLALTPAARTFAEPLPAVVNQYIEGWKTHNIKKIYRTLTRDAIYKDEVHTNGIFDGDIGIYVDTFAPATFTLINAQATAENQADVTWALSWPDARGTLQYVDHLRLDGKHIKAITSETQGKVTEAELATITHYYATWTAGNRAEIQALFSATGVYTDRLVPTGVRGTEGIGKLADARTHIASKPDPDGHATRTKDGRIAFDFIAYDKNSNAVLVHGRDLMKIEQGKFTHITGVF